MKKVICRTATLIIVCILLLFAFTSCSNLSSSGDAILVEKYQSIDDLVKDTAVIVIGTVDGPNEELKYGENTFALTKFKIENTVRGTISDTINIFQTKVSEDPFIKEGDRMILFLKRYSGPVTNDAYRLMGLYQGQYKVEGASVIKNENNKLTGDEVLENIDMLISRINTINYNPK